MILSHERIPIPPSEQKTSAQKPKIILGQIAEGHRIRVLVFDPERCRLVVSVASVVPPSESRSLWLADKI